MVWNTATGTLVSHLPYVGHVYPEGAVVTNFSARESYIRLMPTRPIEQVASAAAGGLIIAVQPDSTIAVSKQGVHGVIRTLNAPAASLAVRTRASFRDLAFTPSGKRVLFNGETQSGTHAETADWLLRPLFDTTRHPDWRQLTLAEDGAAFAMETERNSIRIFDGASGHLMREIKGDDRDRGHPEPAYELYPFLRIAPGAALIAAHGQRGPIVLFALKGDGRVVLDARALTRAGVAFSPDASRIVTAGKTVRLWDLSTGAPLLEFPDSGQAVARSPDARHLAVALDDRTEVWDLSRFPAGNVLQVACALLAHAPDTGMVDDYGLRIPTRPCDGELAEPKVLASAAHYPQVVPNIYALAS